MNANDIPVLDGVEQVFIPLLILVCSHWPGCYRESVNVFSLYMYLLALAVAEGE